MKLVLNEVSAYEKQEQLAKESSELAQMLQEKRPSQPIVTEHQAERDNKRIDKHLLHIHGLVKQLSIFSPAKKSYQKIIGNQELPAYHKVQLLIETARQIKDKRSNNTLGFFARHLAKKNSRIHHEIANIDINEELRQASPDKRY